MGTTKDRIVRLNETIEVAAKVLTDEANNLGQVWESDLLQELAEFLLRHRNPIADEAEG